MSYKGSKWKKGVKEKVTVSVKIEKELYFRYKKWLKNKGTNNNRFLLSKIEEFCREENLNESK